MTVKRVLFTILAGSLVLLALGGGAGASDPAGTLPRSGTQPAGGTIPYAGRLGDGTGELVADGAYDFAFTLYDTVTGGEPLWSEVWRGLAVSNGEFQASLGSVEALPAAASGGPDRWLEVAVRGPSEPGFTALAPRQRLDTLSPAMPSSSNAGAACPHDHFGEVWSGTSASEGLWIYNSGSGDGLQVDTEGQNSNGVLVYRAGGVGLQVTEAGNDGLYVGSAGGDGVHVQAADGYAGYFRGFKDGSADRVDSHVFAIVNDSFQLANGPDVLALQSSALTASTRVNYVTFFDHDSAIGSIDGNGSGGVRYNTSGADLAEMLPAGEGLEPGDVLVVNAQGRLVRCSQAYQLTVVGVYSSNPGFVGGTTGAGEEPEGKVPLAIAGVVPVKVSAGNGPIQAGDLLVASSLSGHAMKAGPNPPQGSVLGKALEGLAGGTGVIQMLVTLQ